MPTDRPRDAVFVLGMHRSGTSVAARLLNFLGVDLGRIPLVAAEDNEKGFWEHARAVATNEAVLSSLGSRWDDPSPLPCDWWRSGAMEPYRQAIERFAEHEFGSTPLFGVKDPRLCRLVPLWLSALEPLAIQPVFVLVLRHPSEIAASVRRRNGLPAHVGETLWLTHMLEAERPVVSSRLRLLRGAPGRLAGPDPPHREGDRARLAEVGGRGRG